MKLVIFCCHFMIKEQNVRKLISELYGVPMKNVPERRKQTDSLRHYFYQSAIFARICAGWVDLKPIISLTFQVNIRPAKKLPQESTLIFLMILVLLFFLIVDKL